MDGVSLTGNDTFILNERILSDLADGDTINIDVPNDIAAGKSGKNGNIIIAFNATGKTTNISLRVLTGSSDDKYINSLYSSYVNDPASFPLVQGEYIKRAGDGSGNVSNIVYKLNKGYIAKMPVTKENVEGDTEQSVTVWNFNFHNTERLIA
jgi:hypothetical protein